MSDLVTQVEWAKRLGISVSTFRAWRADGRIPTPTDNPGWPRWSRKTVDRVTLELQRSGEGRYFRKAVVRRQHLSKLSRNRAQQRVDRQQLGAVSRVHDANLEAERDVVVVHSIVGGR